MKTALPRPLTEQKDNSEPGAPKPPTLFVKGRIRGFYGVTTSNDSYRPKSDAPAMITARTTNKTKILGQLMATEAVPISRAISFFNNSWPRVET